MTSVLNEDSVEKKLRTVTNTQDSIQTLSLWIIHHKANHAKIVELWMRVLKKSATPAHRLTLFYLCNDVVQNCKKKKAFIYNNTFKECLREAASLVRDPSVKGKVERIFNIWGERGVYDMTFVKSLHSVLNGQQVKSYNLSETVTEESSHRPVSQTYGQSNDNQQQVAEPKDVTVEQQAEADAEESARILAEFKPQDMIDLVTAFLRQEVEIKSRAMKLSHLKLDSTSVEAVKQLKDRAVGRHFLSQCDEADIILNELIKRQTGHTADLRTLLETLSLSETFYEEQYREAKIVANAYRNFGARINNMKKKLDELKKSLPEPDSPIPSPDINAPSPENTPPFVGMPDYSNSPPSLVNYNNSPPAVVSYGHGLPQNPWVYGDTKPTAGARVGSIPEDMDSFPGSPSLEAPSPEESPPDLNLETHVNASSSLDSRLESFFCRDQLESSSNPPVYTPQRPLSVVATNRPSVAADEDGSTTPLDDEAPTTPVQDEHLTSPPKQSPPPKKENPIDFLSRLISETQKVPTVKSGTQCFLDSLTMMTMASKKPESNAQKQQITAAPSPWMSWASNSSENNTSPSQPPSPSSYMASNSMPSSPDTFPSVLPMLPPPIPIPVAPPPSLSLDLSMPPPPPPFVLTQALTPRFTSPPPNFQQTSPGQKENWPDIQHSQTTDHANSIRATHSSILKELVPADGMATKTGLHVDHSAMEVRNDDESSATSRSNVETVVDAKTEFGQKLKQKTSLGVLKPHVFVPNPERPNLMTLTVSEDLDEVDMIDDNTVVEEVPTWSEKPDMSRVRSRSQSREKDTSFQHPQTDNWDHGGADVEDSGLATGDSNPISSISSVVTKVEPFPRNNRNNNDEEKFNDRFGKSNNYWRQQTDQKYDPFYKRGHRGRGNFRPFRGHQGFQGVQAYTQAYKEAFQQYNRAPLMPFFRGPPPMNPRLPGYGQY